MINIDINDTKTQRTIIIILIGIIITGLIWYFQIQKQAVVLKELKSLSAKRNEELNKIYALKPELEKMRVSVTNLKRELDSLEAIFPIDPDVPGLITDITKVARTQKLSIMNFKPAGNLKKEYYIENYYDMSITGSYHSVGNFFAQIANFDLLVNVDKINVKTSSTLINDLQNFDKYKGARGTDEMVRSVLTGFRITTYSSLQGSK
jgi:type IV pilus assembly protein PilO